MFKTSCRRTVCVSTTGEAPVTVIVSDSAPTLIDTFTWAIDGTQDDAVSYHTRETFEREGHRVVAGTKINDAETALTIRGDRARSLNQSRTRRFHGDPGKGQP